MAQADILTTDTLEQGRVKLNAMTTELYSGAITFANGVRMGIADGGGGTPHHGFFLGSNAGYTELWTVSQGGNTLIGTNAGKGLVDGAAVFNSSYNTIGGYNSFSRAGATSSKNTTWGYSNLTSASYTGVNNSVFGAFSGRDITTGYGNCYFGSSVATTNTTGYENAFFGQNIGGASTTGFRNVGIGNGPLSSLTTGSQNCVGGSEALEKITTHTNNTCWGHWSGVYWKGNSNTFIGAFSFGQAIDLNTAGDFNTGLGTQSGDSGGTGDAVVTGSKLTFLGALTGYATGSAQGLDRAGAIGYNAKVSESNSFVWGGSADADRINYGFGGESYGSGLGVAYFKNAVTNASAAPTSGIIFHARDSSDANSTLALYTEQAVEAIGTFTASHKIKVWINNVEYWLQLDAV